MSKTSNTDATPYVAKQMFGRRVIYSSANVIDATNIIDEVVNKAFVTHNINRGEIEYLYEYYKGKQPILGRVKKFRKNIINRIVVNRANEIVSFKVGYLCGEPMQYTATRVDSNIAKQIEELNRMMQYENKASKDKELVEWQMIAGTAYRMAVPDGDTSDEEDEAPFEIINLDPRDSFVVYSNRLSKEPLAGVTYWNNDIITGTDDVGLNRTFAIYTKDRYYEIENGKITVEEPNPLGMIPIREYPANNARLGAFEIVLELLDALNNIESNRLDSLEQFVQSFIKFVNCDIDEEEYRTFLEEGAIKVFSHEGKIADVSIVSSELSQSGSQLQVDDIYDAILTICGMPNRNGGSSTSDTGSAVMMRDGWSSAEARAKDSETMFEDAERELLKVVLKILRNTTSINLKVSDIKMIFPRRNYENINSKANVLVTMLSNPKIHPKLAFEHSGMFTDPETAYDISNKYYEEQLELMEVDDVGDDDKYVPTDGQET